MANVNEVKICPNKSCGAPLPIPETDKCLSCGSLLRSPENKYFSTPDYLTMQLSDRISFAEEEFNKNPQALTKALNDVWAHYFAWLKVMPEEDMVASLRDVKSILQHNFLSNAKLQTTGVLINLGKEIGKLSENMDAYIKSGGQVTNYDHLLLPEPPKQSDESDI